MLKSASLGIAVLLGVALIANGVFMLVSPDRLVPGGPRRDIHRTLQSAFRARYRVDIPAARWRVSGRGGTAPLARPALGRAFDLADRPRPVPLMGGGSRHLFALGNSPRLSGCHLAGDHRDIADLLGNPSVTRPGSQSRLIPRDRQRDDGAERHPAKMPAARRPGIGERGEGEHAGERDDDPVPRRFRGHPGRGDQAARRRRSRPRCRPARPAGSGCAGAAARWSPGQRPWFRRVTPWIRATAIAGDAGTLQQEIAHRMPPYSTVWLCADALAPVNTVVYGEMSHGRT